MAVAQRARELRAAGKGVLSFSVGEPDFSTPAFICEAAKQALDAGATRYTSVGGIAELRQAVARDSQQRRPGYAVGPENVLVSVGAKHSLFNLALALFEAGDEVVIPSPYWVSYPEQVRLAGAEPVVAATGPEDGFLLGPKRLESVLSARTKAVVLCSPSNPTGAAYSAEQLKALAEVLAGHSCWVIVDEIYAHLTYDGRRHVSLAEVAPHLRDRLVIVDGVSKAYAMTGWRIGWMLAPAHLAKACEKLQGQSTTNPTAIAQHAAVAALNGPQNEVETMRQAFESRRDLVLQGIDDIDGLSCTKPQGAFYAFIDVRKLLGRQGSGRNLQSDVDIATYLLDQAQCALVPGTAFGAPGFLRFSYASDEATLKEGLRRIRSAVETLEPTSA